MALTTATDVKAAAKDRYIQPDSIRWTDDKINNAITSAQLQIENETGYIFDQQTFTAKFSGRKDGGTDILILDEYQPLLSVTSLTIDGTTQNENEDYFITNPDIGEITFQSPLTYDGLNNIIVEGTYGYNPVYQPAKDLCEDLVVLNIWLSRETPVNLKDILFSTSNDTNIPLKTEDNSKLLKFVFDIQSKFNSLPKRHGVGVF
jgi:hypothetical protein